MEIKICISTTKTHSEKTLPIITKSLIDCGIGRDEIYIFEGGHTERTEDIYDGIKHIKTNHNSFDFTSLIDIVEYEIKADYWFLIHDTCKVGPQFKELLDKNISERLIPKNADKMSLKHGPSMNIGFYKYDYLIKHKYELLQFKGIVQTPEAILKLKLYNIATEDFLFRLPDSTTLLVYDALTPITAHGRQDVYGNGTIRRVEYYGQLDLYKYKANWGQSSIPTINL